jgi:hypothetical protein
MAARVRGPPWRCGDRARHLLYGVLCDAAAPLGTQLSRRSRRQLALLGFAPGRPKPVRLQFPAQGTDLRLTADLSAPP